MVVMVLVLTIAVGSHLMWKRQNALDAVTSQVIAHLSLARQYAITQAQPTTFTASNGTLADDWNGGVLSLDAHLVPATPDSDPDRGLFFVSTSTNAADQVEEDEPFPERALLSDVVRLPRRLVWAVLTSDSPPSVELSLDALHVTFLSDGSCKDGVETTLTFTFLQDITPAARTNALLRRSIRVNGLTGLARPIPRDEEVLPP